MSLPKYREYKDSGIPWLGQMPAHWSVRRYKQVFVEREERSETGQETLLSVSAYTGISPRSEIVDAGDHLSRAESLEGYKVCYPNDLVMNIMLAWNRGLGFSAFHGIVSPAYSVFKLRPGNCPRFLNYMVRSDQVILYYKAFSSGVIDSRLRLYPDTFGALHCVLPPVNEQTIIAAFLDRETAKIDALIAEQEKLLALLAEKRQATISHAVTKGVTLNAQMKDSGLAWLGEIPAHWNVTRIKYMVDAHDGIQMGPFGGMLLDLDTVDTGFKVYGQENTISGDFSRGSRWVSEARFRELERYRLQTGDLVLTRKGSLGNARLVQELPQPGICDSDTIRVRVNEQAMRSEFLTTLLHEAEYVAIQLAMAKRGAILSGVNTETIANLCVVAPPPCEQKEILDYLRVRLAEFKSVADSASKAIGLLKERRSALVAAAVTGQIDVRDAAPLELAA